MRLGRGLELTQLAHRVVERGAQFVFLRLLEVDRIARLRDLRQRVHIDLLRDLRVVEKDHGGAVGQDAGAAQHPRAAEAEQLRELWKTANH